MLPGAIQVKLLSQRQHQPVAVGHPLHRVFIFQPSLELLSQIQVTGGNGLGPGPHQLIVKVQRMFLLRILAALIVSIGNPRPSHRVGTQELRNPAGRTVPACRLQPLKHVSHCIGVHIGGSQGGYAHTVCFRLPLSAVLENFMLPIALGRGNGRKPSIRAGGGHKRNPSQQPSQPYGLGLLVRHLPPGVVPLAEVGKLMGKNGGNLMLSFRIEKQPMIHAHYATRGGKGIKRIGFDDNHVQPLVAKLAVGSKPVDKVLQIVLHQGVIHCPSGCPDGTEEFLPQQPLLLQRDDPRSRIPKARQILPLSRA